MLLNFLLLLASIVFIIILIKKLKLKSEPVDLKPECKFKISTPHYEVTGNHKKACFYVGITNKDKFFLDFPVLFKFYSDYRFKTKIHITYWSPPAPGETIEKEIVFDKLVMFEDKSKEHIYYITDVIVGRINFEIEVDVDYGDPMISFEILENSLCRLTEEYYLELKFPKC